jgi:class 3 adenylate cyclase
MLHFTPTASLAGRGEKQCETRELLCRAGVASGEVVSREQWPYSTPLAST